MIYLSTGGFSNNTFLETTKLFQNNVIKGMELSSGKFTRNLHDDLKTVSKSFHISLHNYFPVPKVPFVFNLASCNAKVAKQSIEHAKEAIRLSGIYGNGYYSFHAGYLIDPEPSELGNRIKNKRLIPRDIGLNVFIENVNQLAIYAKQYNVKLLIENNVLTKENLKSFGGNPLLMTDLRETKKIFDMVHEDVKLLVDVAHLKVSANTLNFDPIEYLEKTSVITKAYHISDNCGLKDSNKPFSINSWFVPYIRKDLDYYSIEVYKTDINLLEAQYILLSDILEDKK